MTGILNLLLGGAAKKFTIIQTFTATSTWTCPTGVTEVEYLVVAGGGGVGGSTGGASGGGGAGGYRTGTGLAVVAGSDYTITVGAGNAGGSGGAPGNKGTTGGNSSIAGPSPFSTITSNGCLLYTSPSPRDA